MQAGRGNLFLSVLSSQLAVLCCQFFLVQGLLFRVSKFDVWWLPLGSSFRGRPKPDAAIFSCQFSVVSSSFIVWRFKPLLFLQTEAPNTRIKSDDSL